MERLYTAIYDLDISLTDEHSKGSHTDLFQEAMDDDFNVPEALSVLFDLAKTINKLKESGDIEKAKEFAKELVNLSNSLGLLKQDSEIFLKSGVDMNESEVQALIDEREKSRDEGDYSKADDIRDQLLEKNIILEDSREGTFWRRR